MKTSTSRPSSKLPNIHPGTVLEEEFLVPMDISAYRLAKDIGIPQTRVSQIVKGDRRITADTALRLSAYFGNSAKFWLGLQADFDLEEERRDKEKDLAAIPAARNRAA
ncbi:MAG: HigA family addiction module antidote protein [Flavobacteriales bacterium]|nr:HigA family addiction module antidote protein [Flavobacteriales bacterium]